MKDPRPSSLIPTLGLLYVVLTVVELEFRSAEAALTTAWPIALLPLLPWLMGRAYSLWEAHKLRGRPRDVALLLVGACYFAALATADVPSPLQLVLRSGTLLLLSLGALRLIVGVEAPGGLLAGHPGALSGDAIVSASVLWSLVGSTATLQLLFPGFAPIPPWLLDQAFVFACFGSQLLLLASEGRVRLLRGLELGTLDRARAGLALLTASFLLSSLLVLAHVGRADDVGFWSLGAGCLAASATKIVRSASMVTKVVRSALAVLVLGVPIALILAFYALRAPERPITLLLIASVLSVLVGLLARSVASPLAPERGRWLQAAERASRAAFDPETQRGTTHVLTELERCLGKTSVRPEIYAYSPGELFHVDTGGNLVRKAAEFPLRLFETAEREPGRVLRVETLEGALVRRPEVRDLHQWMLAHESKCVVALAESDGPLGLLVLPRGSRTAHLTLEEVEALSALGERMGGLVSMLSALARSRARELATQKAAKTREGALERLETQLLARQTLDQAQVAALVRSADAAALSGRIRDLQSALGSLGTERVVAFVVPPGVRSEPWAASLHRAASDGPSSPYVTLRLSQHPPEVLEELIAQACVAAQGGTLVLDAGHLVPRKVREDLVSVLAGEAGPSRIIFCLPERLSPTEALDPLHVSQIQHLPRLEERGVDLQSWILGELGTLGLEQFGAPIGLSRSELGKLIDSTYVASEDELRTILLAAIARASGPAGSLSIQPTTNQHALPASLAAPSSSDFGEAPRRRPTLSPRARRT